MNLKEAFRTQNKLTDVIHEAVSYLGDKPNVATVKLNHLKNKVRPEQPDEMGILENQLDFEPIDPNRVISFIMDMLEEKEKLHVAIRKTKTEAPIDLDGSIELNMRRHAVSAIFRALGNMESKKELRRNQGIGYNFNTDGAQVAYKYDIERITTINFDRKLAKTLATKVSATADRASEAIDKFMVNSEVSYTLPFDVNAEFKEIITDYAAVH